MEYIEKNRKPFLLMISVYSGTTGVVFVIIITIDVILILVLCLFKCNGKLWVIYSVASKYRFLCVPSYHLPLIVFINCSIVFNFHTYLYDSLLRFARVCKNIQEYNYRNLCITERL